MHFLPVNCIMMPILEKNSVSVIVCSPQVFIIVIAKNRIIANNCSISSNRVTQLQYCCPINKMFAMLRFIVHFSLNIYYRLKCPATWQDKQLQSSSVYMLGWQLHDVAGHSISSNRKTFFAYPGAFVVMKQPICVYALVCYKVFCL